MEKKMFGILALALVGLFAVSMVVAMPFGNVENRDAVRDAVESGDYDSWKSLMSAELTEENFEKMTQMHELRNEIREARDAGDDETVEALMEEMKELMPEDRMGHGKMGAGKGFGKGMRQGHGNCPFAD
ncbi:hypothetical protein HNV12_00585 [Methanococcoides sp. SA1]|nr:hypothetical protein [Methanococcoides sp. SA1]